FAPGQDVLINAVDQSTVKVEEKSGFAACDSATFSFGHMGFLDAYDVHRGGGVHRVRALGGASAVPANASRGHELRTGSLPWSGLSRAFFVSFGFLQLRPRGRRWPLCRGLAVRALPGRGYDSRLPAPGRRHSLSPPLLFAVERNAEAAWRLRESH